MDNGMKELDANEQMQVELSSVTNVQHIIQ